MAYTEATDPNAKKADFTDGVDVYKVSENHYHFEDFIHGQFGKENIRKVQATARTDGLNKKILIETGTKKELQKNCTTYGTRITWKITNVNNPSHGVQRWIGPKHWQMQCMIRKFIFTYQIRNYGKQY